MKHDQEWSEFITAIHARLETGEREYGDGSFRKSQSKLVGEVLEELEDVCGWSFVLWCRLKKLTAVPTKVEQCSGCHEDYSNGNNGELCGCACRVHPERRVPKQKLTAKPAGRTESNHVQAARLYDPETEPELAGLLSSVWPAIDPLSQPTVSRDRLDREWVGYAPLIVAVAIALALYWCTR